MPVTKVHNYEPIAVEPGSLPMPRYIHEKIMSGKLNRDEITSRLRHHYQDGVDIKPYLHLVEPGTFEKIQNYAKFMAHQAGQIVNGVSIFVPNDVADARLAICNTCPWLKDGSCVHCGCGMKSKVGFADATCPDTPSRWPVYVPEAKS